MSLPNASSVRTSQKSRECDDCHKPIPKGSTYVAYQGREDRRDEIGLGPNTGWWYWCPSCAEERGVIAKVVR